MSWLDNNSGTGGESERLDRLFRVYRASCAEPEPSADFMPGLWRKIEARQTFGLKFRRWTQVLVAASAMACALMGGYVLSQKAALSPANYVEVLADDSDELFTEVDMGENGKHIMDSGRK